MSTGDRRLLRRGHWLRLLHFSLLMKLSRASITLKNEALSSWEAQSPSQAHMDIQQRTDLLQIHNRATKIRSIRPTIKSLTEVPRGGSNAARDSSKSDNFNPKSKSSNKKRPKSTRGEGSSKKALGTADIFQLTRVSTDSSRSQSTMSTVNVEMKALLKARRFSWKLLGRLVFALTTIIFLHQCFHTAGIPHRQAIWALLQNQGVLLSSTIKTMPDNYQPSPLENYLAHQLARAVQDIMPSPAMPSWRPIVGATLSTLSFLVFTILLPHWFLPFQIWCDYQHVPFEEIQTPDAGLLQISASDRKQLRMCKLQTTNTQARMLHGMPPYYFEDNQRRYYYDPSSNACWEGGPYLEMPVGSIVQAAVNTKPKSRHKTSHVGLLSTPSKLLHAQDRWYDYNHQTSIQIPSIYEALWQRLQSPLVCIQLIGKSLAVLEEGKAAFISLASTVFQHYQNARSSILASRTLQQDIAGLATEFATTPFWIYRLGEWKKMAASDILTGDVFLLHHSSTANSQHDQKLKDGGWQSSRDNPIQHDPTVPVDALVLDGLCVTMESVLTGETVPQTKLPIDSTSPSWNQTLDMVGTHRNSIVFAGTSLLHCASPVWMKSQDKIEDGPPPGVLCLALRTGSYSSKGELLQALTSSQAKSRAGTVSNPQFDKDALKLISIMSCATVVACGSLFLNPSATSKKVSSFRRIIQCTRIATTCIPSDLPLLLSSVVQACANFLRHDADVVCSEPGELLTAAHIDTVVFDKTGTLTADTQALSKIVQLDTKTKSKSKQTWKEQLVLAGCHSLVHVAAKKLPNGPLNASGSLVGDPLEIAALHFAGWNYSAQDQSYAPNEMGDSPDGVEKLWQLIVFPFDPSLRMSSSLCLTSHTDGRYRLWKLVKGSPDTLRQLFGKNEISDFYSLYDNRLHRLESKGFRTIAMGLQEISEGNELAKKILDPQAWAVDEIDFLNRARTNAARSDIHRSDLEGSYGHHVENSGLGKKSKNQDFDFAGFACYTAAVRPSSKRIITELTKGGLAVVMLTGDSLSAATSVAAEVGIVRKGGIVAVLETHDGILAWKLRITPTGKSKRRRIELIRATKKATKDILEKAKKREYELAMTGDALHVLQSSKSVLVQIILSQISRFSVIARASPKLKEEFVALLKAKAGKHVLMCGDGVNDCAAMKEAELSVALLNGFGTESADKTDMDDMRRLQRFNAKQTKKKNPLFSHQRETLLARIRKKLNERANAGDVGPKDVINIMLEERRRSTKIKNGGLDAAKILASGDGDGTSADIKPGEASLASPFSCLRQSIDGLEAVLRTGIATAACSVSVEQKLALNCLSSCFNLSALYRDGFKYGKHMWPTEMTFYMLIDQASFQQSIKPRPHLPRSKRPSAISLFDVTNLLSVASQTFIHLMSIQAGMRYARKWENPSGSQTDETERRPLVRSTSHDSKVSLLLNSLASSIAVVDGASQEGTDLFGGTKFVPNFETNAVFMLSILQGTLTTLLFHKGYPFYASILESRMLCLLSGVSIVFLLAMVLETFPVINELLELKPWQSQMQSLIMLAILSADAAACIVAELVCRSAFSSSLEMGGANVSRTTFSEGGNKQRKTAADEEERSLESESRDNFRVVLKCIAISVVLLLEGLTRGKR